MPGWPLTQESFNEQQILMNQVNGDVLTDSSSSFVLPTADTPGINTWVIRWEQNSLKVHCTNQSSFSRLQKRLARFRYADCYRVCKNISIFSTAGIKWQSKIIISCKFLWISEFQILLTKATTFMNLALTSNYSSFLSKMAVLQMPDGICISGPVGQYGYSFVLYLIWFLCFFFQIRDFISSLLVFWNWIV